MQLNNFFASYKQISFYALPMSRYCKRPFWFTFYVIENLLSFPSLGSNLWVLIPLIISAFKLYSNPLLISRQNICEIFPILAFVKMENRLCKFVLFFNWILMDLFPRLKKSIFKPNLKLNFCAKHQNWTEFGPSMWPNQFSSFLKIVEWFRQFYLQNWR